jgi:hypothetical protein
MTPDYKSLSRGNSRDMSPAAIAGRLDKVAQLYELWKFLRTGKPAARDRQDPPNAASAAPTATLARSSPTSATGDS